MKIEQSQVQLSSQHVYTASSTVTEDLTAWADTAQSASTDTKDQLTLSNEGLSLLGNTYPMSQAHVGQSSNDLLSEDDKTNIMLLEQLIYMLTGKRIHLNIPNLNLKDNSNDGNYTPTAPNTTTSKSSAAPSDSRLGWGVSYHRHESAQENEKMGFSANAVVKTADGKEINVQYELQMERTYSHESDVSVKMGDAMKDPLIIHYGGMSGALSDKKFSFDLDHDGTSEQISKLTSGSGFLALDKNENGKIDNGSELFGPQSGSGFQDLAQYDQDKNQWIDENDPIFNKLRIWTKDDTGKDQLLALGEVGIGAIYLGHVSTNFTLRQPEVQGKIRESSFFLREDGTAGAIQEVDMRV